jgi:NTE family protein
MIKRFTHLLSGESLPSQTEEGLMGECQRMALILQGGGALGSFQGGVCEALSEAGYLPDWVAGISIGAINAAIIVGNPPEQRVARLREFWNLVTNDRVWAPGSFDNPDLRRWLNLLSAGNTAALGVPHFFVPRSLSPWFAKPGTPDAISLYDTAPLRETLLRLVDFDRINQGPVRLSVGAVNLETGNLAFFDSKHRPIGPEHIMASGALPPGFPPVEIDGQLWWDGGIVSNAPLAAVLGDEDGINTLCFQVDLFPSRGPRPASMPDVEQRRKEIQYSSRTRLNTDTYRSFYNLHARLAELVRLLPADSLRDPRILELSALPALGKIHLAHLIYRPMAHELDSKDYEFSRTTMREHWHNGYEDTRFGLGQPHWLERLPAGQGLATYDLTRPEPPPPAAAQDSAPAPGRPSKA